jgi:hypothetical protein
LWPTATTHPPHLTQNPCEAPQALRNQAEKSRREKNH